MDEILPCIRSAMVEQLATKLAAGKDQGVKEAIERYTGEALVDVSALIGWCTRVTRAGVPGETFCLDGVPFLWVGDPRFETEGCVTTVSFDHRMLPERSNGEEAQ